MYYQNGNHYLSQQYSTCITRREFTICHSNILHVLPEWKSLSVTAIFYMYYQRGNYYLSQHTMVPALENYQFDFHGQIHQGKSLPIVLISKEIKNVNIDSIILFKSYRYYNYTGSNHVNCMRRKSLAGYPFRILIDTQIRTNYTHNIKLGKTLHPSPSLRLSIVICDWNDLPLNSTMLLLIPDLLAFLSTPKGECQ